MNELTGLFLIFGILFSKSTAAPRFPEYFPNGFTNNYGYGPFGIGPSNGGFDSFGFYKDKFYNSGLPPKYTFSSYRNYYPEYVFHPNRGRFPGFFEEFSLFRGRHGEPLPDNFELKQQHRFGPYYNGVWGYIDHSPHWYG